MKVDRENSSTRTGAAMSKLFISHSSQDDGFVRELQQALRDLGQDVWIDSRELRGGDLLWPEIQKAIERASAYVLVISPASLQSGWIGKELRYALTVQQRRVRPNLLHRLLPFFFRRNPWGGDKFPVIPLSLNGTKLGVLEEFFGEEPVYISVSSAAGGIEAALNAILVAMGKRLPADVPVATQPKAEPLEELVLELTDLKFHEQDGVRRASARARLVYEPATPGQREVASVQSWRFVAPIGPIEAEELRWYLEKFAIWPSEYFRDRACKVEENLVKWGQLLHTAALPSAHTANVMNAWARIDAHAGRRFSVHVDAALEAGVPEAEADTARESATLLLGLPWELLHDGDGFLFQGAKATRVRRRLPNTRVLDVPVVATPIRILLVTARPEDDACGYLDHRASALPLVEAMEELGGLGRLHVLSPPTLPVLREELDRARRAREPYHVVHFDGHGVYDRTVGLGGLCFEDPQDVGKLDRRRHLTVFTSELGPLLRDHRIPLVFLEACQTAQAEKASESVASELLKVGVASVVAMSHSVLVETARRFVEAFYDALARGARVGDAMLEGQRKLKDDTFRGRTFGAGELRLEDWFVPVLFQEKDDPQFFRTTPARQTQEDLQTALKNRLGKLPDKPETGFIGRSRELLALERLLRHERYAVVRGQGGEGKTALAAELARWMVRSHQIRRAAFVSVETHSNLPAVLDAIGRQLVPAPVAREPGQGARARGVSRRFQAGGARVDDGVGKVGRDRAGGRAHGDGAGDAQSLQPSHAQSRALPLSTRADGRRRTRRADGPLDQAMRAYAWFLYGDQSQNAEMAATVSVLELPNLFALLEQVQRVGDAEATIALATSLYSLLQNAARPRLLERVVQVRDAAAAAPGETWNHARFQAQRTWIEQQRAGGRLREALDGAHALLQRARAAGETGYPEADYDLAMAHILLAQVLTTAGGVEQALPLLDEAQQRFETIAKDRANQAAEVW